MRRPNASSALKHAYFRNVQIPGQAPIAANNHLISSSRSQPAVSISKFSGHRSNAGHGVANSAANHFQSNKVNEMVNSMSIGNNLANSGDLDGRH